MSLPTARKDSNAPSGGAENSPSTGDVATVGFTKVDYEKFRPANSNADVPSSGDNAKFAMGQDGTSVAAYSHQPKIINSESPDLSAAVKGQKG